MLLPSVQVVALVVQVLQSPVVVSELLVVVLLLLVVVHQSSCIARWIFACTACCR